MLFNLELITEIKYDSGVVSFKAIENSGTVYECKGTRYHYQALQDLEKGKYSTLVVRGALNSRGELLISKIVE